MDGWMDGKTDGKIWMSAGQLRRDKFRKKNSVHNLYVSKSVNTCVRIIFCKKRSHSLKSKNEVVCY